MMLPQSLLLLLSIGMAEAEAILMTAANGAAFVVNSTLNFYAMGVLLLGASFTWLSRLEMDEMDRQSVKPDIGRGL